MQSNLLKNIVRVAAALLTGVAATSCFTGVESTPRITDSDVRRAVEAPGAEDLFLSDVSAGPLESWQPGKRFIVTDRKAALVFNNRSASGGPAAGSTIEFVEARRARDVANRQVTELVMTDSAGTGYVYRIATPYDSLARTSPAIPFTIPAEVVDTVARRLTGRHLYIMTSTWRDAADNPVKARRFIEVEVLKVIPGNDAYPVKVVFADTSKVVGRVYMSVGPDAKKFRSFGALFSFTDPRVRYRNIEPAVWENIIAGRVEPGMTRDECRLALGSPVEVFHRTGYSYLHEAWRYESGVYLIFEDGKLVKIN